MVMANVRFLGPDRGGRRIPPQSGYHPQVAVDGEYTSCVIESLDGKTVFAYDRDYRVSLRLLFPERYPDVLTVGRQIRIFEGSHLVGMGVILGVR